MSIKTAHALYRDNGPLTLTGFQTTRPRSENRFLASHLCLRYEKRLTHKRVITMYGDHKMGV